MDVLAGQVGAEGTYDISFSAGQLVLSSKYTGAQASASVSVSVGVDLLIEAIKAKVPNAVADTVLEFLATAIKAIP